MCILYFKLVTLNSCLEVAHIQERWGRGEGKEGKEEREEGERSTEKRRRERKEWVGRGGRRGGSG